MNEQWDGDELNLPTNDGQYHCLIKNNDRIFEATRLFKKQIWFGGCRPFSDTEQILKWRKIAE